MQQIVHYAGSPDCRRAELLRYFGETFPGDNCGGCDNCLSPRATFDGTQAALKFLSCVFRVAQKSRFGVGLNHVVEVLTGADTDKIRRWRHETLSTYGIGGEHSRAEWQAIGRELIRLGFLRQAAEKFSVLELTDEGRAALRDRRKIVLTKPVTAPAAPERRARAGEIACDEALFEQLRRLRKRLADERNLPAYIVFSDVALRQMARHYPASDGEFMRISGVGEKKLAEYGALFLGKSPRICKPTPAKCSPTIPSPPRPPAPASDFRRLHFAFIIYNLAFQRNESASLATPCKVRAASGRRPHSPASSSSLCAR